MHHHIYLNKDAREDILWWHNFLPHWNGVSVIQESVTSNESLSLYTADASGVGFGASYGNKWFSHSWPQSLQQHHIMVKGLFAIVAAVFTWEEEWKNKQVLLYSDNLALCMVWQFGTSKDEKIMHYLRSLFLFVA